MAGAAIGSDPAALEIANGSGALIDGARDVAIGSAPANANDHVRTLIEN
jgi:hypothetical protein